MKKASTETTDESIPITKDHFSTTASEPASSLRDFPFRLIKNQNYRFPKKPKKRIITNDDELLPAA